jgi:hypothetical protein
MEFAVIVLSLAVLALVFFAILMFYKYSDAVMDQIAVYKVIISLDRAQAKINRALSKDVPKQPTTIPIKGEIS